MKRGYIYAQFFDRGTTGKELLVHDQERGGWERRIGANF